MGKINGFPESAFAIYNQNNLNSSQESNKSKRKSKRIKNKAQTNVETSANLKKAMKAKNKINLSQQLANKKPQSKINKKQKKQVYENIVNKFKNINIDDFITTFENKTKNKYKKINKKKTGSPISQRSSSTKSPKKISPPKCPQKISPAKNLAIISPQKNPMKISPPKSPMKISPTKSPMKISPTTSPQKIAPERIPKKRPDEMSPTSPQQNTVKTVSTQSMDSVKSGEEIFQWLINPINVTKFFRDNWEKQPIIIKRSCSSYYSYLLSSEDIDRALRKQQLFFTKNIDITSYSPENGARETHNPPGMATAPLVWDYYSNGCSIRILNPQTFFPKIHALNASLQEYFGCFVGANVYLTPGGTQGFAPHYDDIEAFVIQLEGSKLWKLYSPRTPAETLPRFSSGNFTEKDLGAPIQEVLLEAGDMLYFPRGIIHQGSALEDTHSLHITLSMYQKNSWADFLETLLPAALKTAIEEDVSFREGLPLHYLSHVGLVHSDKNSQVRSQFLSRLQDLLTKIVEYAPVDAAADQLGKRFIHDALPPFLRKWETERTAFGDGEQMKHGVISNQAEMCLGTRIKLIRYNCIRVVSEEDNIRIYYSLSNSKEYHGEEPQYLEIEEDLAPAIDALINYYPSFISVEQLPIEDDIAKVQIASDLWEHGIIMTDSPLGDCSDDE